MDDVIETLYAAVWAHKGWLLYRPFTHLSFATLGPEEAHVGIHWGNRGDVMLHGPCYDTNEFGTRQSQYRPVSLLTLFARDIPVCPRCLHRVAGYAPVYAVAE